MSGLCSRVSASCLRVCVCVCAFCITEPSSSHSTKSYLLPVPPSPRCPSTFCLALLPVAPLNRFCSVQTSRQLRPELKVLCCRCCIITLSAVHSAVCYSHFANFTLLLQQARTEHRNCMWLFPFPGVCIDFIPSLCFLLFPFLLPHIFFAQHCAGPNTTCTCRFTWY